jgi:cytoskeletal protein CcmA (bactofilin family)
MWNKPGSSASDTPQQPNSNPTTGGRTPDERRTVAWVGKSVIFRGDLISAEDMTIDGRIEGTIEVRDHHLTIGPNASIEADVVAKQVTIFGKVNGSVTGNEKVEIRIGASVEADLACSLLSIQEGAHFSGKVAMQASRTETDHADGGEQSKNRSASSAS